MQIFISSSNLTLDKNVNAVFLDSDTLHDINNNDVLIGSGTFRDELMIKSLLDRGLFPLIVTLDIDGQIASMFKNLSYLLSVTDYLVDKKLIDEIKSVKKLMVSIEEVATTREVEEEDLLELLIANQTLIYSQIVSTGRKGSSVTEEILKRIHILKKEGRTKDTLYVLLEEDNEIKILRTEIEPKSKIKKILIKNELGRIFETLMQEHQESCSIFDKKKLLLHKFENITANYKKEFLIIDQENKKLLDVELTGDFRLKLYAKINFDKIAFYRLYSNNTLMTEKRKTLLHSIHNHLNEKGSIENIEPLLYARNLYEGLIDKDKKANMLSDLFIHLVKKLQYEREQTKDTYFHLAMIVLKSEWSSLNEHMLTNIFHHLLNGIDVNSIIKKEFSSFISNFDVYSKVVREVEVSLDANKDCYAIDDFIYDYPKVNQRVLNIEHIDNLRRCIGEKHSLRKKLDRLHEQLAYQEVTYDVERLADDKVNVEEVFIKKNDNEKFIQVMMRSMFHMQSIEGKSVEKLIKLLSYALYILSKKDRDKDSDYCCLSFIDVYIQNDVLFLYDRLEYYFKTEKIETSYSCNYQNLSLLLTTKDYKDISYLRNSLSKQESRLNRELLKIGNFYRLLAKEEKRELAIEVSIDKIVQTDITSEIYCENKITLDFLAIFLSGKADCNRRLSNFFTCFKKEYKNLNHTHYNQL